MGAMSPTPFLARGLPRIALAVCGLFPVNWLLAEPASLEAPTATLTYDDGVITVVRNGATILSLRQLKFDYTTPLGWRLVSTDGEQIVLELSFPTSVDYRHAAEDDSPRMATLEISRHGDGFHLYAAPEWGDQITLEFASLGDHFFGLSEPLQPDNQLSPDLTGSSIVVDVAGEGQTLVENYATAFSSFYLSSAGYGAFFDTFARGRYDFAINGKNRIHHDTGILDWYLFFGDNGAAVHQAYFTLIGKPKAPPLWGLGPIGWRDQNNGGAVEILGDVGQFQEHRLPLTGWWVDRPYSEGANQWSKMNFGPGFENPNRWIGQLENEMGVRFMTWTSTATFGDKRFPKHLAGAYTYADLSDVATVEAFGSVLAKQHSLGVRGHKIDRADEAFPVAEEWADDTPLSERRNRYVYLTAKVHHDALEKAFGADHFMFMRAAIHGTQPFVSALWGGDPRTSWDGFRGNFANAMRCGFMGFPVWGSDVGGYLGDGRIPEDLYLRWLQAGSMSGLFEIKLDGSGGAGEPRLPWLYDEAFLDKFRSVLEARMSLLPYFYSLSRQVPTRGVLMQPMAYRHFDDPKTFDLWDQFYVGDILVAPVFGPETSRVVYLPVGTWCDFDDPGVRYEGGRTVTVDAPLEKLPRFLPLDAIYVTGHLPVGNVAKWSEEPPSYTFHAVVDPSLSGKREFSFVDSLDEDAVKTVRLQAVGPLVFFSGPAFAVATQVSLWLPKAPGEMPEGSSWNPEKQILTASFAPGAPIDVRVTL